nr:MAG TPA: hypothetical protein [Caudoviricetes sp.]
MPSSPFFAGCSVEAGLAKASKSRAGGKFGWLIIVLSSWSVHRVHGGMESCRSTVGGCVVCIGGAHSPGAVRSAV